MPDEIYTLSVTRLIDAPIDTVWATATGRLADWWCSKPWTVEIVEQGWGAVADRLAALVERG